MINFTVLVKSFLLQSYKINAENLIAYLQKMKIFGSIKLQTKRSKINLKTKKFESVLPFFYLAIVKRKIRQKKFIDRISNEKDNFPSNFFVKL